LLLAAATVKMSLLQQRNGEQKKFELEVPKINFYFTGTGRHATEAGCCQSVTFLLDRRPFFCVDLGLEPPC
jgi:hypothetical protein